MANAMRRQDATAGLGGSGTETQDQESIQRIADGLEAAAGRDGLSAVPREKCQTVVRADSLRRSSVAKARTVLEKTKHWFITFSKFIGPGFMISVAYSECLLLVRCCPGAAADPSQSTLATTPRTSPPARPTSSSSSSSSSSATSSPSCCRAWPSSWAP